MVNLTARRIEPGGVVVELQDAGGKPVRGYVEVYAYTVAGSGAIGATGKDGRVRMAGLWECDHYVLAQRAGQPAVDIGDGIASVPPEERLRGHSAFIPAFFKPRPDAVEQVVLREQPVGFVIGRLKPPLNYSVKDFMVQLDGSYRWAQLNYLWRTGEFVAGPFPPSVVRLRTTCLKFSSGEYRECDSQILTVVGGGVTRAEFEPKFKPPSDNASDQSFRGPALSGHVFLVDGKSPAFGAIVTTFGPSSTWGIFQGLTDARGEIRVKASLSPIIFTYSWPPVDPSGYVVVARLPGSHGGSVVPLPPPGKRAEIVLPHPISLRGRVTVGGQSASGKAGTIRVFAASEGKDAGRLGPYLSVQTTAQEDGSFDLAGLTPGRYSIQAALDNIWLSPSTIVDVKDGSTNDLTLAIPAPGGPVVVKVVGADGKPAIGRTMTIDRPDGPLTTLLWPATWVADGAGEVHIPALEAGRHTVRATITGESAEVVVPALPTERTVEVQLRVGPDSGR